jgi:hypothetical protein
MQSASSANALQAALLQAAAAAAAASQFPYNIKQYLEDPRNFSQFYNPFTSLQSIGNTSSSSSSSSLQFQNENSNMWSRPLESLYAAAIAAASTANTTTNNNQTTTNSSNNSNTTPLPISLPPLNQSSINNQFNLLSNAGVNMNLNNSFFLNQLAAASSSSSSSSLNNLMSSPNLSMDQLKPKMNLHEMTVQAAALAAAAAAQQQQQQQQFLYHPYSNQIQQYHLQQNQQTK